MLTFDEMISFLIEKRTAKYKLPERLEIIDNFPMSGDGQKVLKKELVEQITRQLKID
jgi:non-ribosomal peptide synthetase component E (peptide arylation enzyme)